LGISLVDAKEISARDYIWPALLMERVETTFNVATMMLQADLWPEFGPSDWQYLSTQPLQDVHDRSLPASEFLKQRYGSVEFFRNCMVHETPAQAAAMDTWSGADTVVIEAAVAAKQVIDIVGQFLQQQPEFIESVIQKGVIVGHADSKYANILIHATTRDQVVEMVKARALRTYILDPQVLPLKEGMLVKPGSDGRLRSEGISYAHWNIVPEEQQVIYGAMLWQVMGREDMYWKVVNAVLETRMAGLSGPERELYQVWILLQTAYKLAGVETLVQSRNWLGHVGRNGTQMDPYLELTMKRFPRTALKLARQAADLGGLHY
jgi:hypothetical protein